MRSNIRTRQLRLGALVTTCGVLVALCLTMGAFTGTASAALRLTPTVSNSFIPIDTDVHWFASSRRPVTYGGYQYYGYWDQPDPEDGLTYLTLVRRRLSDNLRVALKFKGEPADAAIAREPLKDGHNFVGLGLAPRDGTIHLSWSIHTSDRRHRYFHSTTRCMERTQEEFTIANCGFRFTERFREEEFQASRTAENSMTYPEYINDKDGKLYFSYRQGASSNGNQVINAYDESTHTWSLVGAIIRGQTGARAWEYETGDGTRRSSRERGVYALGWEFDKDGYLHVAWVYRENGGGLASQNGIHYAYSRDLRDWYSNSGTRIGEAETAPIDSEDRAQTVVYSVPPGWYPGEGYFTLDRDNNPHIVLWTSDRQTPDSGLHTSRQAHIWRTTGGTWTKQFIEGSEANSVHPSSSSLFFDRANNAYALFAHLEEEDWGPYNADAYKQVELPSENVTWQEEEARDGLLDIQLFSATTCLEPLTPPMLTISTTGFDTIQIQMKNQTTATEPTVSWTVEGEAGRYTAERSQTFARTFTASDTSYRRYELRFTDADWEGTLRALKMCIGEGTTEGIQSIDWIKFYNSTTRATVRTYEFARATTMYAAEASPADNWERWTIEPLLSREPLVRDQGFWGVDPNRYDEVNTVEFSTTSQGRPGNEQLLTHVFYIAGDEIAGDWRFDTDTIGWTAQRDIEAASFRWTNDTGTKGITGRLTGTDSQIVSRTNLKIPIVTRTEGYLHVTMKNSTRSTRGRVYFITDTDRTWNATKSKEFPTTRESSYTQYDIEMTRVLGWARSTIYQLRLDPVDDGTTREGTFNVDRIWISNNRTR